MRNTLTLRLILTLVFAFAASSCGDELIPPEGAGITGSWTFTVDVTVATGVCGVENEEDDDVETALVSILEVGSNVQAISTWFSDGGNHTFLGTRSGNNVVFSGSYFEEGEILEATYRLTVSPGGNSMEGTETWDWNGECPESMSQVTATRN